MPPARTAAVAGVLAVLSIGSFAGLAAVRGDGRPSGVMALDPAAPEHGDLAALLDQQGVLDSDRDGLPDAVENLVFGSDPARWNTSGGVVPDGWLARHGGDPNDPQAALRPAAIPPASGLPAVYGNRWPDRYTLTMGAAYAFGRPADWSEAAQGPFDSGIDPRDWDQDDDGIADGWLVHHGLDPRAASLADQRLAGAEGLTVREAFEHGTDPRSLDSDRDGLRDRDELAGPSNPRPTGPARFPPSDPARLDTAGAGVCDGYLVRHGLDPSDPRQSLEDLDRDGATTRQEYSWSANRSAQACTTGGLDPTRQQTAAAGIPDGWLIQHGLDPLQAGVASRVTQLASKDPRPAGTPEPARELELLVRDEYAHGRPPSWDEARDGPWHGGTDPRSNDTDRDGLGDAYEVAGRRLSVAAEPSQPAGASYVSASDPTLADGDGDGLLDADEATSRTDALRPDTDFDGLADGEEEGLDLGLDPSRADSTADAGRTGDLLRDGDRLSLLRQRSQDVLAGTPYPYAGPPGGPRAPAVWAAGLPGVSRLGASPTTAQLASLLAPAGDADDDKVPNILDPDLDGDGLPNGPEVDPREYAATRHGLGPLGSRSATDPLSPDTDGDQLRDAWEVEHGVLRAGRLTLDPALWDSDGDCLPPGPACRHDGAEDPDEDGTAWPRFIAQGGIPALENVSAPFTNLREQAAGTDPNDPSGDADGLADGWKAFWGIDYPLLPRTVPSLGLFFPAGIPDSPRPVPGTHQPQGTASARVIERDYWRSVPAGAALAPQFGESFTGMTTTVQRADGPLVVANVTGTVRLDYQDVQALGTNPYLADTDGDGLPDWWEHLHAQPLPGLPPAAGCVQAGLDPLRHEPTADPDGDRLTNTQEFAAGSDPLCRDSDLGGVPDGEEWLRASGGRLDPTLPGDDRSLLDDNVDQDLDGAPDFDEITRMLTDHHHPDTDGDGLLDGPSLPAGDACWTPLTGPDDEGDARARRLLDLGMAYEVRDGCHVFLGEGDPQFAFDPRDGDDYGVGVPTGWILMKMDAFNAATDATRARDHYGLGRPAWWQEGVHGPWWGGADPKAGFQPLSDIRHRRDLDGDGLRDVDGVGMPSEDPFPAGNPGNAPRQIPGATPGTDPRDADAAPLDRRFAAQGSLAPAPYTFNARNTVPHPNAGPDLRAEPCLHLASPPSVLVKGQPATLAGHLSRRASDGSCPQPPLDPLPGIAVEAFLAGRAFAADYSDGDGAFRLDVNVSSTSRSLRIPSDAVSAFQGLASGTSAWTPDASAAPVGPRQLTVRSSATPLLRAVESNVPITLRAGAVLDVDAPEQTRTDRPVPVRIHLRDTAGAPLRDPVRVQWLGRWLDEPAEPGPDGVADVLLAGVPAALADDIPLLLQSQPSDGYTQAAQASRLVSARRPGVLEVEEPPRADAGTTLRVKGQYRDLSGDRTEKGVPGADVQVTLGLPGGTLTTLARSDKDGRFAADFALPADVPAGLHRVHAATAGTSASGPASDDEEARVRGAARFDQVLATTLRANESHAVVARLVGPGGAPVADAPVTVVLGSARVPAQTDDDGLLSLSIEAPLRPGPATQTLSFAGNDLLTGAVSTTQRIVAARTTLALPSGTLARGADAHIPVALTDANGHGVAGARISVTWGDEPPRTVLTDASGRATFDRPAPDAERLGTVLVKASYPGSQAAGLAPSNASRAWTVRAEARFDVPSDPVVAGTAPPMARLVDAGTGEPLPQRAVLRGPGRAASVTDAQGRVSLGLAFGPDAAPAVVHVPLRFAGDDKFPVAETVARVRIVSPTALDPQAPEHLTTGRATLVHAHIQDGRGLAPQGGAVEVLWQDIVVGHADMDRSPVAISVTLPANASAGASTLTFRYTGSDTHAADEAEATVRLVQGARLVPEAEPVRPGGTAVLRVRMSAGDVPLPDRTVVLVLQGATNGIEAVTDADGVAVFHVPQASEELAFVVRSSGDEEVAPASSAGVLLALAPRTIADQGLSWLAIAAGVAAVAVAVALALVLRGRDPLHAAIHQARRALQARGPDERRVLEAYRAIEDAAIAMEVLAGPATTPRALEAALYPRLPVAAHDALDRVMTVFEAARYGTRPIGALQRDAALGALAEIQASLHGGHA